MKIAIQGHLTRGKEVIQILESLGGINRMYHSGRFVNYLYYISSDDNTIAWTCIRSEYFKVYTLEEFEKEFPFKIGDKVILPDYSNKKGTIISIEPCGPIFSYFIKLENRNGIYRAAKYLKPYEEMNEERNITLTIDKAKEWYKKGGELKEVALQAYSEKELTKVELPKTWEEFCDNYPIKGNEAMFTYDARIISCTSLKGKRNYHFKDIMPSKESGEAHLALIQLEQLRDCWRQGWKPDWNNAKQDKYCIGYYRGRFKVTVLCETRYFLSFPTIEMAEEFLKCFRDLIEKAGDLI